MIKPRVIVTGATGKTGSVVVSELLKARSKATFDEIGIGRCQPLSGDALLACHRLMRWFLAHSKQISGLRAVTLIETF